MASSWGEQRGRHWSLLSDDSDRTLENGTGLWHGRVRLGVEKQFFTRETVARTEQAPWGYGHRPKPNRVQGAFGQCSKKYHLNFERSFVEQGFGFDDSCGTLPTQDILWFCYSYGWYNQLAWSPLRARTMTTSPFYYRLDQSHLGQSLVFTLSLQLLLRS